VSALFCVSAASPALGPFLAAAGGVSLLDGCFFVTSSLRHGSSATRVFGFWLAR
jgi:hypothetical protein